MSLPALPNGAVTSVRFSRSEKKAALYVNGDRSPNNLYVLDLATKKATKVTESLSAQIDSQDLVDTQVVRFKARDGVTIPNILWKPHQATAASKAPALVWVHGGPGGQTTAGYSAVIQYLANHGYVVLGINNRGSSGYGKTFLAADDQKHGREPLWDCVDAKAYSSRCHMSTASGSESSAAVTADTWCSQRWHFSQRHSRSAWTSSEWPIGSGRSRACPPGGKRSARHSTRR